MKFGARAIQAANGMRIEWIMKFGMQLVSSQEEIAAGAGVSGKWIGWNEVRWLASQLIIIQFSIRAIHQFSFLGIQNET